MKKRILFLTALLMSHAAFSGNRPGAFTLTLGEGGYFFAAKRHVQNTDIPNISLAYNFDQNWAAEVFAGLTNTNQSKSPKKGVHGILYTLDGIYRFMPHDRLEPYVSFGIGELGLTPNNFDSEYQGNVNAGIGTQWFCDRSIAFKGEIRDIYTLSGGKNDVMLNFGVSFLMGG